MKNLIKLSWVALSILMLGSLSLNAKDNSLSIQSDPMFKDFQKLQHDMEKMFENFNQKFYKDFSLDDKFFNGASISPKSDLKDLGKEYEIKVDLPGVNETKTKVQVKDKKLIIDAKSQKSENKKSDKFIKRERFIGVFHKEMLLPKDADGDKLKTSYKDGVLTIKIPKK